MHSPPPFGVEGISRGLSGQPAPMAADEDQAMRHAHEGQDLELLGLADPASTPHQSPAERGWRTRLRRALRRG